MKQNIQKTILVILDGWGIGDASKADGIHQAETPVYDSLCQAFPMSSLDASGEAVGLPKGQMGNSEVGHLNIGAGRVVYQELVRINKAIEEGSFFENAVLKQAFEYAREKKKAVHFLGLVSPGGVHSMDSHLVALSEMAGRYDLSDVFIHALTDGRDTDPHSGYAYLKNLLQNIEKTPAKLASLVGRYYTMDRDKRWERIKKGYDLMVHGKGEKSRDILKSIQKSYDEEVSDEFIKPVVMVDKEEKPLGRVKEGDVFICFNFRTDRLRQITTALTQKDIPDEEMHTIPLHYLTMTEYDSDFEDVHVILEKQKIQNTVGEYVAEQGLNQLRIAETEKYAHVTFFFSGGREEKFNNEERILVPSPKVATYDLQPEMSAPTVKRRLLTELNTKKHDFICLNFANGDMVGHTGVYEAILKAVETVDTCLGDVVEAARKNKYELLIIADHGNADYATNADGSPNTAHSLNKVPCILVSDRYKEIKSGILADVAPTLLKLMDMDIPEEMSGTPLVK